MIVPQIATKNAVGVELYKIFNINRRPLNDMVRDIHFEVLLNNAVI
jgi:hypothetical protein